ncbi:MAG: hypothetical protein AUK54_05055 [Helicobacteraceae bacterium CG2_30_36_10]|nr:MAG: hypothetical protein AUK54_05055 [Helicobacteraceae bacterium CG2_30_36_10]
MNKTKVIISACLLGEYCRYDGKTKQLSQVVEAFKEYEIIPFCPEAPLFGTPRQKINVMQVNGQKRIITDETNEDVTRKLQNEIEAFINRFPHAKTIVLKSKSPSCGLGTTPIFNERKEVITLGDGLAATILKKKFPHAKIVDELNF